ncbi:MAG TPA: PhoD-like phosphatase N-terminal domain-containing protein, partial [Nitrospira sp.]|nr:PhoD-like phosphatase N-terminal domain-containing protein [Nitrospira sp.]
MTPSGEVLLPQGTAVGDVTSQSAVLWLRTDGPKSVQLEWASVEAWKKISAMASVQSPAMRTPVLMTGPETDDTLSIPFSGLSPATRYRYHILINDAKQSDNLSVRNVAAQGEF